MPPEDEGAEKPRGLVIDSRYISAGLAAVGVMALAAAGFVTITTPGEQECQTDLTDEKVKYADCSARIELLTEAKDACKDALEALIAESP
jgi:hypothetical protein